MEPSIHLATIKTLVAFPFIAIESIKRIEPFAVPEPKMVVLEPCCCWTESGPAPGSDKIDCRFSPQSGAITRKNLCH